MNTIVQCILYLAVLVALAIPLGGYIAKVMEGEPVFLSRLVRPCENGLYRLLRIDPGEDMGWKKYLLSALAFHALGLLALFAILMLQGVHGSGRSPVPVRRQNGGSAGAHRCGGNSGGL